jgi:exopolysaccharide biosynthesis operon protein EpsL
LVIFPFSELTTQTKTMLRFRPLPLLVGALFSSSAWAYPSSALHLYGGLGWGHDDNLLRVADDEPAFDNTRGDSWTQLDAGLVFDKTYSRQRLSAIAKLSKVNFDHFKQLDYDGKDVEGTWYWQVGNHLDGKLGSKYEQVLAPYTDFRSNERNLRQEHKSFFDGTWQLHPSWGLRAGFTTDKYTYALLSQHYNNRTEDASELEGDYLPASGSTVGLVLRHIRGRYPNRRPLGQFFYNDDFTQDELKARVDWHATGSTSVQALAGWARRDQPSFGGRTSGLNGRIGVIYTPRGKLSYNAAVWRDFAPIESNIVSYTLNRGGTIGATWDATAKIKVDASAVYERRSYNPRQVLAGAGDLRDAVRSASVRAVWSLRPTVQLSAGYTYQARTGSPVLGTGSFKSNSVSFNASAQF